MAQLSEVKIQCQNSEHIEGRCEASKENNSQNALTLKVSDLADTPMCRICYNGPSRERLLKPCKCKGTIKNVHRSCLERWLESTSTDTCELCNHRFATKRSHKSFWHWCRQPETRRDRRNFIGDCACFLFLTPLGFATFWLCTEGAVYFQRVRSSLLETVALIILAFFLVLAYVTWIALCTRYHLIIWSRWRNRNYNVRIVDRPSSTSSASSASEIETINLSEPPATNHRLPIIAHPLPAYGTLPRHLMNGPPRFMVSFTRRPQMDEPQGNATLNMYATRRPQNARSTEEYNSSSHAIRRLQMNDPRRNPSLNPYVTRPQIDEPPRNQTFDSHDTRRSEWTSH
ncbi:hypothetical protein JTE90_010261 [Oedothorax gibbosus]|uniref:RING-CH-type domain-containing protein n=1 Tax=Oedothorax gibbosus TaxID=931172 RepID=A0AAV6TLZ0_9ARAC|nr:hypothetical protein JTE90_010261 [Oedothorax gibbosus]